VPLSSWSRSQASLAEAAEELSQIGHHQIRVGGVREVAARVELGVRTMWLARSANVRIVRKSWGNTATAVGTRFGSSR